MWQSAGRSLDLDVTRRLARRLDPNVVPRIVVRHLPDGRSGMQLLKPAQCGLDGNLVDKTGDRGRGPRKCRLLLTAADGRILGSRRRENPLQGLVADLTDALAVIQPGAIRRN